MTDIHTKRTRVASYDPDAELTEARETRREALDALNTAEAKRAVTEERLRDAQAERRDWRVLAIYGLIGCGLLVVVLTVMALRAK